MNPLDEPRYPADTLGLAPEEMRRLGYKVVDIVVDRLSRRQAEAAISTRDVAELTARLGGALPEEPVDTDASLELLATVALAHQQHGDHPRYFARIPGPSAFAGILGEWMGAGFNSMAASWAGGSGPATVELIVIDWLAQMIGMPAVTEGVLVSGGSLASLTAFCVARSELGHGVVYVTDQTHWSVLRDLQALAYSRDHIRILPTDSGFRMPLDALASAIAHDKRAGLEPKMVVATAGTTNTGAVDPLSGIADICERGNLWLHVDGAYGAAAALTPGGRAKLAGMERADSLVIDPHKWLFQPYDVGACLVTRKGALERCFAMAPEYLKDVRSNDGSVNFGNRSLELTRRSRALKLWMSIRTYGAVRFREAVQRGIHLAEAAERYLRRHCDVWEVVSPAQLGIVCFALKQAAADTHALRAQRLADSGFACVTCTSLQGKSVLRLCTINPLTTERDIEETLDRLSRA